MRRVVRVRSAGPSFRSSTGGPTPVVGGQLRRLEVGHAHPTGWLPVNPHRKYDAVLQILVPLPLHPPPAQGVGEQSGQHGHGRKGPDYSQVVDGLAAKGHQRRFQVQIIRWRMVITAAPLRTVSAAQVARSSRHSRSAFGISQSSTDITRRASFPP